MKCLQAILAAAIVAGFATVSFAAETNTTAPAAATAASAPAAAPAPAAEPAPSAHAEESAPVKQAEDAADAAPAPAKSAAHKKHHVAHHASCKKGHCAKVKQAKTVEMPLSQETVPHRKWMGTPGSMNNVPTKD